MNISSRQSQPDDIKIEEITDSFNRFALRDIRVNIPNPIAAFILASCFIDQMAAFAYNTQIGQVGANYKKFIKDYLKNFDPLNLYENLRCLLVHNYSISPNFALSSEPHPNEANSPNISVNNLTVTGFVKELEAALSDLSFDLRNNLTIRKNALIKYDASPPLILVNRSSWQYDEKEADYLIKHYQPQLLGKYMSGETDLVISSLVKIKIGEIYVVKCMSVKGNREYESNLDVVTQEHRLIYPIDTLKSAGLHE